ncbi:protein FAR1-RELATED SEQUENCE 5-like [Helianthus annuus]|uniref:protein FAR1-RELATED SEQUENCE 5-like n=1 Tax=Helianthus annuus TaxID=4232 RepID=UPI000B8F8F00|nr:protein FAR1-RELATED SEQUENCE 5-like [Helianthus annuus]
MTFDLLENAFLFYQRYAKAGGFTARKGTQYESRKGVIHNKWFLCSKEGTKPFKAIDSTQEAGSSNDNSKSKITRRVPSIRPDVKRAFWYLLPENRGINYVQEEAVNALSAINVGPVRAFNIMRTLYGGFNKVGATKVDFKNFKRDLNRYNMMCVPFTSVDNHYRNVTLGAAIIGNETAETYSWLLNAFRQAFGREPPVIVTDQDPAMRKAIQDTWPEIRHRLCMWHIMDKLITKFFISEYVVFCLSMLFYFYIMFYHVGANLCNSTDFKKRLCGIVWTDALLPEQFETEWGVILADFDLVNHEWLHSIYHIRDTWIPAYYRDEHMSGLMRTSSRSESENHFFGQFCNPNCTLVEFLGHFDSAIEAQRHEHRKNDHDTRHTNPEIFAKEFVLEQQAANIYTQTIFFDAQLEIQTAIHKCGIGKWDEREDNFVNFSVKDFSQTCATFFQVMMRQLDMTMSCSCNRQFPERYIMRRWTGEVVPNSAPGEILGINESDDRYQQVNGVVREITRDHVVQYQSTAD